MSLHLNISRASFPSAMLVFLLIVSAAPKAGAQQEWGYTQYLFNLYDINSAYAGNHNSGSFALRHRSQWIGFEGAPVTQQFSFHAPVFHEKVGVGIKILNESIGARNQQMIKGSVAYKVRLHEATLSMGIAGGILRQGIDRTKLTAADAADVQLMNMNGPVVTPVIDASIFFNTKKFYLGVESARLNRSAYHYTDQSLARLYYNLSIVGGFMKTVKQTDMLQLSTLIKLSENNLWQAEVDLLYLKNNKYWFGGGYRFLSGINILACLNLTEHLRLGASFDIATNEIRSANNGSAEVFIGYNLKNRSGKSIRYF